MHYHFNYPYYPAAWQEADQGIIPNGCITQGSNGTQYGYDSSVPIGANTPDALPSGQSIYANYWLADGTFIMQFSDAGNKPIPDVEFIFTVIDGTLLQYVWQPDTLLYEASNPTLATQLITDYVEGEDVCYTSLPLLQKFISYDMNITDVEGTNTLINNTSYAPHFNAPVINATQNGPGSILVDGTTDISTDFKPNISQYSIEETITGNLEDLIDGVGQGTFTQRTEQRLLTHTESHLGVELVVNGTFDTDTDWTLQGLVIADGKLNFDGVADTQRARQGDGVITDGLKYYYSYEVKEYTSGQVQLRVGGTVVHRASAAGVYYGNTIAGAVAAGWEIQVLSDNNFIGSVDNVSVKEVLTQNKYYINGIEQATPSLPDPDTVINLNDTAIIGYNDLIESREAPFNVHTEILTPTFVTTGPNLYPNWELINGSHINQDIPLGTLPDGHVLAFNTGDPCNATYNDNGDGTFSYLFNQVQDHARLVLQQTIGYGVFEVGKRYRYQAKVRTVTFNPIATKLRAIHIAAAVDLVIIDADNAMIDEEVGYELKWIDFEVTDSDISRANFRHGCGVWDVLTTAQETIELAIYELTTA